MKMLPEPIGSEVRRELARFGPLGDMAEIVAAWPTAVGPAIAANAWPARVARDGTLHVATRSSAWAYELTQLTSSVLAQLRERLGETCPTALRFAVGHLPEPGTEGETEEKTVAPKPTAEQIAEAAKLTSEIEEESLRETVARAAAASLAASKGPA